MKGKKIVLPVLLTSLATSPAVASLATSVSSHVFADEYSVQAPSVSVQNKFPKSVAKNTTIEANQMPVVTTSVDYVVIAIAPNGKEVKRWYSNPTGEQTPYLSGADVVATFTPTLKGTYTFVFKAAGGNTAVTLCDNVYLSVTEESYTLTAPSNNYWALPSTVPTGNTVGLSVPVLAVNGVESTVEAFDGTVDANGVVSSSATGVLVTVVGPNAEGTTVAQYITNIVAEADGVPAHYTFTAAHAGTYTVRYDYYKNGAKVANIAKQTIRSVAGYSVSDQYKLEFNLNSSIDSVSKELGTTVNLPTVKAVNSKASSTNAVGAYTKIKVTYLGGDGATEADKAIVGTDAAVTTLDDFKYTYKWAGNYRVEYTVSIANLGLSVTQQYTINGVTDTTKPVINLVDSYSWDTATKKIATFGTTQVNTADYQYKQSSLNNVLKDYDLSYNLNTVYQLDSSNAATVTIPAVFATDNYDMPSNIAVTRRVYRSGNVSDKLLDISETEYNDVTKAVTLNFGLDTDKTDEDQANWVYKYGKFTVEYTACDTTRPSIKTTLTYSFEVKEYDTLDVTGTPTVYMQYFDNTRVNIGDTVTVTKPSAVDYKSQSESLELRTYYYVGEAGLNATQLVSAIGEATELKDSSLEDGKYSFDVPSAVAGQKLYVFAVARNKYNSEPGVVVREFNINGTVADTSAPVFGVVELDGYSGTTFVGALGLANEYDKNGVETGLTYDSIANTGLLSNGKAPFGQGDIVKLPAVQFTEDNTYGLNVSVKLYYNAEGDYKNVSTSNLYTQPTVTASADKLTYTVSGGSFEAVYAGTYTVVYTATNLAGITTSVGYGIVINDTVAPTIVVVDKAKFANEHEVGTQFTVPEAQIRDNGILQPLGTGDVTWVVEAPANTRLTYNGVEGFTPYDTGDYYVYYTAKDSANNTTTSQKYHISVVANDTLDINYATTDFETEFEWAENTSTQTIRIPNAVATMPNFSETVDVNVTVKNSANKSFTVTAVEDSELYSKFEATGEGVYTVTYSAQDRFGRKASLTLNLSVGDSTAPIASWKSTSSLPASKVKVGSTWQFDISMMDITDDSGNTLENEGITYTETMTGPSGTVNKGSNNTYTFSEVGTYSFTLTLKDKSGNTSTENLSIEVEATDSTANTKTHTSNAVSTVLIVLSVVVLAGVVTYFVLSGRKKTNKTKKEADKSKENK